MLAVPVAALALQVLLLHHLAGGLVLELVVLGVRLVSGACLLVGSTAVILNGVVQHCRCRRCSAAGVVL